MERKLMAKVKTYMGRPPSEEDGWEPLEQFEDGGVIWQLFEQDQPHSKEWFTYKLAALGRAPHKANYWFAKNMHTGQVGYNRDLAALRAKRPKLHESVEALLTERMF